MNKPIALTCRKRNPHKVSGFEFTDALPLPLSLHETLAQCVICAYSYPTSISGVWGTWHSTQDHLHPGSCSLVHDTVRVSRNKSLATGTYVFRCPHEVSDKQTLTYDTKFRHPKHKGHASRDQAVAVHFLNSPSPFSFPSRKPTRPPPQSSHARFADTAPPN